jgi:adenylate cyclase
VRAYKVLLGYGETSERTSPKKAKLELPDRPSIAVLPFTNMSGNPEQEYFADGMTDDLITDLSKISGLFVIARNSTFVYKGERPDVRKVSSELGVRFVLEGSVRRAGDQVRINAQLIDATTGGHLWAERYDAPLTDVFALQDSVTQQIVTALAVNLTADEDARQAHKQTDNPEAYDAFLQGWAHYRQYTRKDFVKALDYFKRAVELDSNYARAHAAISGVYTFATVRFWHFHLGWHDAPSLAERHLQLAMKDPTAVTHRFASMLRSQQGRHEEALAEADQMIALDRNDAENYDALGYALLWAGRPEEAIDAYNKAMRLDPHYPAQYLERLGAAYFSTENFEVAVDALARARRRNPGLAAWMLAAAYGHLGRVEEAAATLTRYQEHRGQSKLPSVDLVVGVHPYKRREDAQRLGDGLIKAGLCCQAKLDSYLATTQGANRNFTRPDEGSSE